MNEGPLSLPVPALVGFHAPVLSVPSALQLLSLRGQGYLLGVKCGSSDVSPQDPDQQQHCWKIRMVFIPVLRE